MLELYNETSKQWASWDQHVIFILICFKILQNRECPVSTTISCILIIAGVYGDVVRVKILYNKRDSALIQFKEPQHAQTGKFLGIG